jgi:hypothetical protein
MADFVAMTARSPTAAETRKTTPRLPIAVVIPVHNRRSMLERALESVWAQHPSLPAEILVVDDQSTDASPDIAATLGATVLRMPIRSGPNAARNVAIAHTAQPWLAFLDSDDEWLPHHLDTLWQIRGDHALIGAAQIRQIADRPEYEFAGSMRRAPWVLASPAPALFPGNVITTSSTLVSRQAVLDAGSFPMLPRAGDLALWCRVLVNHTGVLSSSPTVIYHGHRGQLTNDLEETFRTVLDIAAEVRAAGAIPTRVVRLLEGRVAWDRMRVALRRHDWPTVGQSLVKLLNVPLRQVGALSTVARRAALRRHTRRFLQDGTPRVALLGRLTAETKAPPQAIVDLRKVPLWRAAAALARDPTAEVIATGRTQRWICRLVSIRVRTPIAPD